MERAYKSKISSKIESIEERLKRVELIQDKEDMERFRASLKKGDFGIYAMIAFLVVVFIVGFAACMNEYLVYGP